MTRLPEVAIASCAHCPNKCRDPFAGKVVYLRDDIKEYIAYSDEPTINGDYCTIYPMELLELKDIAKELYE